MRDLTRRKAALALCCAALPTRSQAFFIPPFGMRCSTGWSISGYYTATEAEFGGKPVSIDIDGTHHSFPADFLHWVKTDGWAMTRESWFLGWNKKWRRGEAPLNSRGKPLQVGGVAVDPKLIPLDTMMRIPDLPSPWGDKVFIADDTGGGIVGKRLDVYCGCGPEKRAEALRITSGNLRACFDESGA
jgi:3D (Asp-Asp-Asp) domain-containing protein